MKQIICLIFFIIGLGTMNAQNFNRISKNILKCYRKSLKYSELNNLYKGLNLKPKIVEYHEFRKETRIIEKIHDYHLKRDTIFLMEIEGDPLDPSLYLTVWNRTDTISYSITNQDDCKVISKDNYIFPKYMYYLVSQWNYDELKKEGKEFNGLMIPLYIFATRLIIDKKKYSIDSMSFDYFFNFDRDYIYH